VPGDDKELSELEGGSRDEESEVGGEVVGGTDDGDSELGDEEDGEDGALELGGQGDFLPGEEAHGDDGVGVVTLTDGEGRAGGLTGRSWCPVSPRCRPIQALWWGS